MPSSKNQQPGPFGWIYTEQADRLKASLPRLFSAPGGAALAEQVKKDTFHWEVEAEYLRQVKDALGKMLWPTTDDRYLAPHNQTQNDCTSHGASGALEELQILSIMKLGYAAEFKRISSEALYAGAVTTIMGTRGDNGAFTGAPLQYAHQYGFLERKAYGDIDLTEYDGKLAARWTQTGVPSALLEHQSTQLLKLYAPIHSIAEMEAAILAWHPVTAGTCQGFEHQGQIAPRDKDGFCKPGGVWPHAIRFRGVRYGRRPGFAYQQSWGPGRPGGPRLITLDDGRETLLPEGVFFVDFDVVDDMIRTGGGNHRSPGEFYAISAEYLFTVPEYKLW